MRPVAFALVLASAAPAFAQETTRVGATAPPEDLADQGISAEVGIAAGGRVTPGGLRIGGHYLYQLSATDWFDGTASFTYGAPGRGCYAEDVPGQMSTFSCDHGLADGRAVEVAATVRRMFGQRGAFRPFARAGVGISLVRFIHDDVDGVVFPVHLGGGLRTTLSPAVALVTQADFSVGVGAFDNGLGAEPQLGFAVTAGAEFNLR
ncbi:MAG: hypothetical protein SFX73_04520 [Kofleriaceae bacterium]|nr:hypothetical protein [Kofleriaceae bacterium]